MITLDCADLISSLSTDGTPYTITRTALGVFTAGVAVPGAVTSLTVDAAVYQATGRDLLLLPEARRSESQMIIFTVTRLYTGAEAGTGSEATYQADKITIGGLLYEVHECGSWPGQPGFFRAVAQALG